MPPMPRLSTLPALLLPALLLLASAQTLAGATGTAGERWYLIELIVFERTAPAPANPFLLHEGPPRFDGMARAAPLRGPAAQGSARQGAAPEQPRQAYQRHPGRHLVEAYRRLARHPDYQVLLHESWLLSSRSRSRPVQLGWPDSPSAPGGPGSLGDAGSAGDAGGLGGADGPGNTLAGRAQGLVRARIARHLDVDVDFAWFPPVRDHSRDRAQGRTHGRITQTRRIKLQQLHYFDHPAFGILLQASPLEKREAPGARRGHKHRQGA